MLSVLVVSKSRFILGLLACLLLGWSAAAEEYKLNNGETLAGEALPASANDQGVQVKLGEGQYQRVPWANFSQESLKEFAKIPKLEPLVEPFIEITREEKIQRTEVPLKAPPRLERPAKQSLLGALFGSGPGIFMLLAIYGAWIYAGYEVAIFRAQPPALVAGLAAIPFLGLLSPIIFISMPTKLRTAETPADAPSETAPALDPAVGAATADTVNPMLAEGAAHPSALHLAHTEPAKPTLPKPQIFQRGQFTFNRRFIETKFVNFFSAVRRDADRDMILSFKTAKGEFVAQRISRIAANDLHIEVHQGHAHTEMLIPFSDIQEIRLKHKDA